MNIIRAGLIAIIFLSVAGYFFGPEPTSKQTDNLVNSAQVDETIEGPDEDDSCITKGSFLSTNLIAYPQSDVAFMTTTQIEHFIKIFKKETGQFPPESKYEIVAVIYPWDGRDPEGRVNLAFFVNGCMFDTSFELSEKEWEAFNKELE